jgi:hypothetical protein
MIFGNIVGMPVNCNKLIKTLTKDIPSETTHLRVWVGARRKGISCNHAKIIAVDRNFLHTGGHNMWDMHYLKHDPVHDLSLGLNGRVTHDSHLYANEHGSSLNGCKIVFVDMSLTSYRTISPWY